MSETTPAEGVAEAAPAPVETPAVVETAVAAPVESTPAPAETPAAEPAAPAEPEFKAHTETPTLLEGLGDKPAGEEPKAADPAPAQTPAAPTYDLKFPDNLPPKAEQIEAFTAIAAKHNIDQETAQSLVDMHLGAFKTFADSLLAEQHRVFSDTRAAWVDQIRADPELGGSGHETAMKAVARMRDMLVPERHRAEFDQFLRVTGAGDHPAFMRILHNAARYFDEPAPPAVQAMPTADRGVNPRTFREAMYTHPTSQRAGER